MLLMNTPKRLYEALPWIYGAAGVWVIIDLHNWVAAISGGLLMLTGALVLLMRHRFRRPINDEAEPSQTSVAHGPPLAERSRTGQAGRSGPAPSASQLARQRALARARERSRARQDDEVTH